MLSTSERTRSQRFHLKHYFVFTQQQNISPSEFSSGKKNLFDVTLCASDRTVSLTELRNETRLLCNSLLCQKRLGPGVARVAQRDKHEEKYYRPSWKEAVCAEEILIRLYEH